MRFAKTLMAASALSLVATPAMAQATASNAQASVASVSRAGGLQSDESDLRGRRGGASGIIIALLAAAAIIAGIIIAIDSDGDDDFDPLPVSP
ncbi:hypothetical protein [Novosphingopyxis sp.]|uniref:hypothetical protein n=1 Tax=Novosphingopyxis sp. TaxID=2709690 RepID=UPI003B599115